MPKIKPQLVSPEQLLESVRSGDKVTIRTPSGRIRHPDGRYEASYEGACEMQTGRAVMRSSHGGWVLNMGGKDGTPGLVDERNIESVQKSRNTKAAPTLR